MDDLLLKYISQLEGSKERNKEARKEPPLCEYITPPMRGEMSFMPDILFWHPANFISGPGLKCPVHINILLEDTLLWADGAKGRTRYKFRYLYGMKRNAVLIPRLYQCIKCKYFVISTHDQLMDDIIKELPLEYLLLHRSGFTGDSYHYVVNSLARGEFF